MSQRRYIDPRPGRPELEATRAHACTGCGKVIGGSGTMVITLRARSLEIMLCATCTEPFTDLIEPYAKPSPLPVVVLAKCNGTLDSRDYGDILSCRGDCPVHLCRVLSSGSPECGCHYGKRRVDYPGSGW